MIATTVSAQLIKPRPSQIAFACQRDGNLEIYIMNADGTSQTRLTNHFHLDYEPAISPDGEAVAFYSRRSGNAEIYFMDADDGSDLVRQGQDRI